MKYRIVLTRDFDNNDAYKVQIKKHWYSIFWGTLGTGDNLYFNTKNTVKYFASIISAQLAARRYIAKNNHKEVVVYES